MRVFSPFFRHNKKTEKEIINTTLKKYYHIYLNIKQL